MPSWHSHIDTGNSGSIIRSQVLAAEETVVVGTQQGTVIGVDTETGDRRWRVDANGTVRDLHGAGEQIVVVSNAAGGETNIVAHDADNGTEQWRYETNGEVRGIVADGQDVYATTDNALVALGNP